jgi:hypothetical protein
VASPKKKEKQKLFALMILIVSSEIQSLGAILQEYIKGTFPPFYTQALRLPKETLNHKL